MSLWGLLMGFRGYRPRPTAETQTLDHVLRRLDKSLRLQEESSRQILDALRRAKEQQMALTEQVRHLVEEVNQSRGLIASMATFVRGVPGLIRQAVNEAVAEGGLSPEDLAAISQAADDLDASQAEILSAMQANAVPGENTGVPPARTEMGGTAELAGTEPGGNTVPAEGGEAPADPARGASGEIAADTSGELGTSRGGTRGAE